MEKDKLMDCERTKIEKWSSFQLSNKWKKLGVYLCGIIFLVMIALKFTDAEPIWLKGLLRRGLLIGLLIVSVSKEKEEDEMITSLRAKAYTLAFIMAVVYALIQPLINHLVFDILGSTRKASSFSYFQVLSFMLIIQIMFFEVLKRNR